MTTKMAVRTYRVQATGRFSGLTPAVRSQLRDEQAEHDLLVSAWIPQGTFTYSPSLTRFTLRYLLVASEDTAAEADEAALIEAELLATQYLESRGITHKPLTLSATCMDDVKVRGR